MDKLTKLLNYLILVFFIIFLPFYYLSENSNYDRSIMYFLCVLATIALFLSFSSRARKSSFYAKKNVAFLLFFLYFTPIILNLLIGLLVIPLSQILIDVAITSYCLFALIVGVNFLSLFDDKYFMTLFGASWIIVTIYIFIRTDMTSLTVNYGSFSEEFDGAYQYVGDTFAFTSVVFLTKIISLKSKLTDSSLNIFSFRVLFPSLIIVLSLLALFFNGSRAPLFVFICVIPYLIYCIFQSLSRDGILKKAVMPLLMTSILITCTYWIQIDKFNIDISTNRNSELLTGNSTSAEGRNSLLESGQQEIFNNFLFGNYVEKTSKVGRGFYIHNVLATIQTFGIVSFSSYLFLGFMCLSRCLQSKKHFAPEKAHLYQSLLLLNILQIIFFRYAPGYHLMFFNFGMLLNINPAQESKI